MGLVRSLRGTLRVELTSADVAAALQSINDMGIQITDVEPDGELTVRFTVPRRGISFIENMAVRRGERLRILERNGMYWPILSLSRRPVLVCGMIFLMILALFIPSRVLFVSVEGNEQIPSQLILEAAHDAGVCFGANRRDVRSEKMKNALLGALPQLQWAGINTYGCRAVITVRERAENTQYGDTAVVSNMIASSDGVITSCTVTDGTALCAVGEAVEKGQILVSGYTDHGLVVSAGRAQGEIFAQTRHALAVVTPSRSLKRLDLRREETNFSLIIGKKRINFKKGSGISGGTCVKMHMEYYLTLPGGYRLPVTLVKETIQDVTVLSCNRGKEQEQLLSTFARNYLHRQMIALTILDAKEEFQATDGFFRLTGRYDCSEMIGREQCEQIGDFHGKTD